MLTLDARPFVKDMRSLDGYVRKATVYALTDAAKDIHSASKARIAEAFDRPTPYTRNSLMTRFARLSDATPAAEVRQKPTSAGRHYLAVEEEGGTRPQTGVERLLSRLLRGSGRLEAMTPARGARLDKSGSWSRGERSAALEALKRHRGASTTQTATWSRLAYFAARPGGQLSPGIYARKADRTIKKVAHITDRAPRYKPLLGLHDRAAQVFARRYPEHFARILDRLRSKSGK
jgi:hypothetical protein